MSPKVICCVVLTMFTDNIISILYEAIYTLSIADIFTSELPLPYCEEQNLCYEGKQQQGNVCSPPMLSLVES